MTDINELAHARLYGIEIRASPYMPEPGTIYGYPDWRQRLARNLARPSTGRWEPLHRDAPTMILMPKGADARGRTLMVHPKLFAVLKP